MFAKDNYTCSWWKTDDS